MESLFSKTLLVNPTLSNYLKKFLLNDSNILRFASLQNPEEEISCNHDAVCDNLQLFTLVLSNCNLRLHKEIFTKRCPYFRCVLDGSFYESETETISLPDIALEDIASIIEFIYTGTIKIYKENFISLYLLVDYLQIHLLKKILSYEAESILCEENCFSILCASHAVEDKKLFFKSLEFSLCNGINLLKREPNVIVDCPVAVLEDYFSNPFLRKSLDNLAAYIAAVKAWIDEDKERCRQISHIFSTFQVAALVHKHPNISHLLEDSVHRIENDKNDNWQRYVLNSYHLSKEKMVVVFGGEADGNPSDGIECFQNNCWSFQYKAASIPSKSKIDEKTRKELFEVIDLEGLYQSNSYNIKDDSLERDLFDCVSKCKEEAKAMTESDNFSFVPENKFKTMQGKIKGREFFSVLSTNKNDLHYLMGGFENFELQSKISQLRDSTMSEAGALPLPSAGGGCAMIDNVIYYAGGETSEGVTGDLWKQVLAEGCFLSKDWAKLSPLPLPCSHFGLVSLFGFLYVCGGQNETQTLRECWRYNPEENKWQQIASMATSRAFHGLIVHKGLLYAIGGKNGRYILDSLERYDPYSNEWSTLESMHYHRSSFGVCVASNYILVAGGNGCNDRAVNRVERYNVNCNAWHLLPSLQQRRTCCVALEIDVPMWKYEVEDEYIDMR